MMHNSEHAGGLAGENPEALRKKAQGEAVEHEPVAEDVPVETVVESPGSIEEAPLEMPEELGEQESLESPRSPETQESTEDMDQPVDFETEGKTLEEHLDKIEARISKIEEWKQKMESVRESLGLDDSSIDEILLQEELLSRLQEERIGLLEQKMQLRQQEELENVFAFVRGLTPEDQKSISETGKLANGSGLTMKDGTEVEPDMAKKLGKLALEGAKFLSKAFFAAFFGIVGGFLAGMAEALGDSMKPAA